MSIQIITAFFSFKKCPEAEKIAEIATQYLLNTFFNLTQTSQSKTEVCQ